MNESKTARKFIRFALVVLVLTCLPFLVVLLNQKLSPQRRLASDPSQEAALSPALDAKALKYKILTPAKKVLSDSGEGLSLGLSRIITDEGYEKNLCEEFPTVDWIFSAEGIAVAGEVPQIIVRAPCVENQQNHVLESPALVFSEIFRLKPLGPQSMKLPWSQHQDGIQIYTRNSAEYWPRDWAWTGLRLYGANKNSSVSITGFEIISVVGEPIFFKASE